jgi:hypothetical protein
VSVSFSAAVALEQTGPTSFRWTVPSGWEQGRGAWGGLVAVGVVRAVAACEPAARRSLRSLSLHLAGPLRSGAADVQVEALRQGTGMSTWSAVVRDERAAVCAHAVAISGSQRADDLEDVEASWGTAAAPALPPWRDVPALPTGTPLFPVFTQHVEMRAVEGIPGAQAPGRTTGNVRFTDQGTWDEAQLYAIVDAWYPTALVVLPAIRPIATVAYAAHLLIDPSSIPGGQPLVHESFMVKAAEGYTTEVRRLWTVDGRLAIDNHQSIVVIR